MMNKMTPPVKIDAVRSQKFYDTVFDLCLTTPQTQRRHRKTGVSLIFRF